MEIAPCQSSGHFKLNSYGSILSKKKMGVRKYKKKWLTDIINHFEMHV